MNYFRLFYPFTSVAPLLTTLMLGGCFSSGDSDSGSQKKGGGTPPSSIRSEWRVEPNLSPTHREAVEVLSSGKLLDPPPLEGPEFSEITTQTKTSTKVAEEKKWISPQVFAQVVGEGSEEGENKIEGNPFLLSLLDSSSSSFQDKPQCSNQNLISEKFLAQEFELALKVYGHCLRSLFRAAQTLELAVQYFLKFYYPDSIQFSQMSESEILDFLHQEGFIYRDGKAVVPLIRSVVVEQASIPPEAYSRIRREYRTDSPVGDELEELELLAIRRHQKFQEAEARIVISILENKKLLEKFKDHLRYRILLALGETASDFSGKQLSQLVMEEFQSENKKIKDGTIPNVDGELSLFTVSEDLDQFPVQYFRPYAVGSLIPQNGKELDPFTERDNLFSKVWEIAHTLGGSTSKVTRVIEHFKKLRPFLNPPWEPNPQPVKKDSVRVAFIDDGVDFIGNPEVTNVAENPNRSFQAFLNTKENGGMGSYDYSDFDSNPYLPDLTPWVDAGVKNGALLGHGTRVLGSYFYTLGQHGGRDLLLQKDLDIAMWKISTSRAFLSGDPFVDTDNYWQSIITSFIEAVVDQVENQKILPDIVSISMMFDLDFKLGLSLIHREDIFLRSPWLWVMAAGNEGRVLEEGRAGCLEKLPPHLRPKDRILCVGAIQEGVMPGEGQVATYSNFGEVVDVYAPESFHSICGAGTSCAVTSVSAAATIIKKAYPEIKPEQIKEAIVEAARLEPSYNLHKDCDLYDCSISKEDSDRCGSTDFVPRIFDIRHDLSRALEIAQTLTEKTTTLQD